MTKTIIYNPAHGQVAKAPGRPLDILVDGVCCMILLLALLGLNIFRLVFLFVDKTALLIRSVLQTFFPSRTSAE